MPMLFKFRVSVLTEDSSISAGQQTVQTSKSLFKLIGNLTQYLKNFLIYLHLSCTIKFFCTDVKLQFAKSNNCIGFFNHRHL